MPEHTDDLRNVQEGDSVTIETSTGKRFSEVTCSMQQDQTAVRQSGEVRETHLWSFQVGDRDLTVSIMDGLKSSPDDPDFPVHKSASLGEIGLDDGWVGVGYFETVEIHGPVPES